MRFGKIWADQNGNTAIIFGFALVPILALTGGGVDLTHRAQIRMQMQSAADSAALAAARFVQEGNAQTDEEWEQLQLQAQGAGQRIFAATRPAEAADPEQPPAVTITREAVTVSAAAQVPTSFLSVLGIRSLDADAFAEVGIPDAIDAEIALVLDYSGSMLENNKYGRMSSAARDFIERITRERGENIKIGIVPFSEYVYADIAGRDVRDTDPALANQPVTACLMNRDYPYSAAGDPPLATMDATRWPAADPAAAPCAQYAPKGLLLRDLTTEFSALTSSLASMVPIGYTNIALAAEMGWQMLTPEAPFTTSSNARDDLRKIMIVLTDGVQTVPAMGPGNVVSTLAADETTAELCDNADAAGIQIFTVAYDVNDQRVRDLLAGCASSAEKFHEARGAGDISAVFESIFDQITASVWLSR